GQCVTAFCLLRHFQQPAGARPLTGALHHYRPGRNKMPFTEEQLAFRESIRKMVEKEVAPVAAKIDAEDKFPQYLADLFGEMGLLQLWVPEEYGGPGGDLTTVCILKEELGRASLTASTLAANNSIGLILPVLNFGTDAQK